MFPGRATNTVIITRDISFPARGTHISKDMCFRGTGIHISKDIRSDIHFKTYRLCALIVLQLLGTYHLGFLNR